MSPARARTKVQSTPSNGSGARGVSRPSGCWPMSSGLRTVHSQIAGSSTAETGIGAGDQNPSIAQIDIEIGLSKRPGMALIAATIERKKDRSVEGALEKAAAILHVP